MAQGGKSEKTSLKKLTEELQYLLNISTQQLNILKENVCDAKKILNLSICTPICRSEYNKAADTTPKQSNTSAQLDFDDEEFSLEGEITRILQVAEKVRDTAYSKQLGKSRLKQSVADRKAILKNKEQVIPTSKTKRKQKFVTYSDQCLVEAEVSQRCASTSSKSFKIKMSSNNVKTTYQQDFSLKKGKSVPCLNRASNDSKKETVKSTEKKLHSSSDKSQMLGTSERARSIGGLQSKVKKETVKREHTPVYVPRKILTTNDIDCNLNSRVPSSHSIEINSNELCLSEEILRRSQIPKYRQLLEGLRDYYAFMYESNRKTHKEEEKLKENFLKKCSISANPMQDHENELESIFEELLSYCGWANGLNNSFSHTNLNQIKDAVVNSEERLKVITCGLQKKKSQENIHCNLLPNSDGDSRNVEGCIMKEYSLWNSSVSSLICKGVNFLPYIYYNYPQEWMLFQTAVHDLQECHIHLMIFKHIRPIITQYFYSQESSQSKATRNDEEAWKDTLALLLKTMAAIADFSGHLTMPILASVTADNMAQNIIG